MIISLMDTDNLQPNKFRLNRPQGSGDYLFVLFKSPGKALSGKEMLPVKEGIAVLYAPGQAQRYYPLDDQDFLHDFMHFTPETDYERFLISKIPTGKIMSVLRSDLISDALFCIKKEKTLQGDYKKEILTNLGHNFLYKLIMNLAGDEKTERKWSAYQKLSAVRTAIYESPQDEWSIKKACDMAFMSESYFKHSYKSYFGVSLINDVISARIEMAKLLLQNTDFGPEEISEKCGYNSYEHFIRQFREKTGLSPVRYRKRTQD